MPAKATLSVSTAETWNSHVRTRLRSRVGRPRGGVRSEPEPDLGRDACPRWLPRRRAKSLRQSGFLVDPTFAPILDLTFVSWGLGFEIGRGLP
jgi:hypothetical protein